MAMEYDKSPNPLRDEREEQERIRRDTQRRGVDQIVAIMSTLRASPGFENVVLHKNGRLTWRGAGELLSIHSKDSRPNQTQIDRVVQTEKTIGLIMTSCGLVTEGLPDEILISDVRQ